MAADNGTAAKELGAEGIRKAEIVLAVGLPFSDYGREKKALVDYYMQKPAWRYEFEGMRYDVAVGEVMVYLKGGIPVESRCITITKRFEKHYYLVL